jgi:citrate synthase
MYAGVAAGVGELSGSLHGGANARVMEMLMKLEAEKDVPGWVKRQLEQGQRIMDRPRSIQDDRSRAKILERCPRVLAKNSERRSGMTSPSRWKRRPSRNSREGQDDAQADVDFYARQFTMMGIPQDLMTPIFAISRIAGWCAHIIRKNCRGQEKPALYRPRIRICRCSGTDGLHL